MKKENKKAIITRRFTFSAAHRMLNKKLPQEENNKLFGLCQNIHGHNYVLEVSVIGVIDRTTQCVVNLNLIREIVDRKIISLVDHQYLNEIFDRENVLKDLPVTLESLGSWIWEILYPEFKSQKISLFSIRLWESENNSITFTYK